MFSCCQVVDGRGGVVEGYDKEHLALDTPVVFWDFCKIVWVKSKEKRGSHRKHRNHRKGYAPDVRGQVSDKPPVSRM